MEKLSELTGLSSGILLIVGVLLIIGIALTIIKRVIGMIITFGVVIVLVYFIFGVAPSDSVDSVKNKAQEITQNIDTEKIMQNVDKVVAKLDDNGKKVFESDAIKVYYNEEGKQVIEDLKNKTVILLEDFKKNLSEEEIADLEETLS